MQKEDKDFFKKEYDKISLKYRKSKSIISTNYPDVAINFRKRFQTITPELGPTHVYNTVIEPLQLFCQKTRLPDTSPETYRLSENLQESLRHIKFSKSDNAHLKLYTSYIEAHNKIHNEPFFLQMRDFIEDFKNWIAKKTDPIDSSKDRIYLEPFQKNILLHVVFFLAVMKLPLLTNHIIPYIKQILDIDFIGDAQVDQLKQKVSIFLVPRRHGKTWFIIPIISFLLKNIVGLNVGYVAHQKHVSQFVLKNVEFRCRRLLPDKVESKDNVISVQHDKERSTALFASCYNTNVSIFYVMTNDFNTGHERTISLDTVYPSFNSTQLLRFNGMGLPSPSTTVTKSLIFVLKQLFLALTVILCALPSTINGRYLIGFTCPVFLHCV